VLQVELDPLVLLVLKEQQVLKVLQGHRVLLGHKVLQVELDPLVLLVLKVYKVLQVQLIELLLHIQNGILVEISQVTIFLVFQ
jgi:hypothetical protein